MPITTSCSCGRKLNLKDELAGKTVKCPQCGSALKVPDEKSTATAVATPPPRPGPADSRIMEKPTSVKKKEDAGPKVVMSNFKSLEDFDAAGNLKKKKREFTKEEEQASETGSTGGEMAKIAAEALKAEKEKPKHRCPACGKGVKPDDVICTKCGTNIKTGRRIGESGIRLGKRTVMIVLGIMAICAAGAYSYFTRIPPPLPDDKRKDEVVREKGELEDTIAKLKEIVEDGEPDHTRALPHVANIGSEALPTLVNALKTGGPLARRKSVKLMEILAFNGYRTEESVRALGALSREPDTTLRDWAAEALQWSAWELAQGQAYWVASEADAGKFTDVSKMYALPFNQCRQMLFDAGVKVKLNLKLGKIDHTDSHPTKTSVLPIAAYKLEQFWKVETIQGTKLTRLIQAVRSGRRHLLLNLIYYLEQEPITKLSFTPSDPERNRAFRCLSGATGRQNRRFDDWMSWWNSAGKTQYPLPKDPEDWKLDTMPEKAPPENGAAPEESPVTPK